MVKQIVVFLAASAVGLVASQIAPAVAAVETERPAFAQAADPAKRERRPVRRPRIEVRPERLLYRECVDTTREVYRPYWGYVVTPGMRCWWVRR
jgi:hypothetical protein